MIPTTNKAGEANFTENIQLFANAQAAPEKFNLYKGLQLMAARIAEQSDQIKSLERQLQEVLKILKSR